MEPSSDLILVAVDARYPEEGEVAVRAAKARGGRVEVVTLHDDDNHDTVLAHAKAAGASLIVLSSGHERLNITSLAGRVIRHAPAPVLIAREPVSMGPVIVGTDFSESSEPALAKARAESERTGHPLIIVHVVSISAAPLLEPDALGAAAVVDAGQVIASSVEAAKSRMGAEFPGMDTRVLAGAAAQSLLDLAEAEHASLLVEGSHGRTGLGRLLIGSTAEAVARAATCSVMVVPAAKAAIA